MDKDVKDANGFTNEPLITVDPEEVENHTDDAECYSESNTLLPPRRGGMSRNPERVRRKVQWNDKNGNKLAEVLVFEPSDNSDSDEDDSDSCVCNIM
ncbi:uncharacterized protein LOC110601868 isoform X1 [Manihot esculenta]|uniref:Uncharacterized protein n=1 Tax=Manihot esculenta TaxID=3983 RepID=A0A2C9UD35_MANES|nr:uncharacterized protein LOC110601868 isoform X1 [Manihot esculenta]OAY28140.1 hypothetical protein MANES_15G044300v8 [Manihot esculenta]